MARKPTIGYWSGRKGGGYFCNFRGQKHELALGPDDAPTGPTYLAALSKFGSIMKGDAEAQAEAASPTPATVREVLDEYLKHISKSKKPERYRGASGRAGSGDGGGLRREARGFRVPQEDVQAQ